MVQLKSTLWTRTAVVVAISLSPLIDGCGKEARPLSGVSVTDSAGVTVVDVEQLERLGAPRGSVERLFRTSESGVELFGVSAARLLDGGRVAVGNGGTREVLMLDSLGALVSTVGGAGEGPGEFRAITSLHRSGETGGIVVYDTRLGRWSHFDEGGELLSTEPMSPPNRSIDLLPLVVSESGDVLAIYGRLGRMPAEGIQRDTTPLLHYAGADATPDTLSRWGTRESIYERGEDGWSQTFVGFGRSLASFGNDEWAVLGDTDRLDVSLLSATGELLMTIRGGGEPVATTQSDGERWRQGLVSSVGSQVPEELRESFRERFSRAPFRESYPAFDEVAVDVAGRVWIGGPARYADSVRSWVVFGSDGTPTGALELPADAEVLDIADDRLVTLERDGLGVETLSVWRIDGVQ